MVDRYLHWTNTGPGRFLSRRLGLPRPVPLHRWSAEHPTLQGGPLLHLAPVRSALGEEELAAVLDGCGLAVRTGRAQDERSDEGPDERSNEKYAAVVVDATGIRTVAELVGLHRALHPVGRSVVECGRFVVLGTEPDPSDHHQAAAQQALEGFTRSLGKETGGGRTAQLVRFAPGAPARAGASTLRFLLSPKSAYVSGQVIRVGASPRALPEDVDEQRPLAGRTALVTGSARGIGEAVAETLARDGARVLCLDVPQAAEQLQSVAERLGGEAVTLDMTAADAGEQLAAALPADGLDVLVHNAGITQDRRLVNMKEERWSSVLDVNLASVLRTTDHLLKEGALRSGTGRIVATASIAGLAGNAGQTNYGASKAGIVGFVRSLAPRAAEEHGVSVNAVAPGFIETEMTGAMPFFLRQAGRRMSSQNQGGLPVDVAETTAWYAHPASGGVTGQVVRVCGQSLLGA